MECSIDTPQPFSNNFLSFQTKKRNIEVNGKCTKLKTETHVENYPMWMVYTIEKEAEKNAFLGNLLHMSIAYQVLIDKTCCMKKRVSFLEFKELKKKRAAKARKTKMPQFQTPCNLKFMLLLCRLQHTAQLSNQFQTIPSNGLRSVAWHLNSVQFILFYFFKFYIFYFRFGRNATKTHHNRCAYFVRWTILFTFGFIYVCKARPKVIFSKERK